MQLVYKLCKNYSSLSITLFALPKTQKVMLMIFMYYQDTQTNIKDIETCTEILNSSKKLLNSKIDIEILQFLEDKHKDFKTLENVLMLNSCF